MMPLLWTLALALAQPPLPPAEEAPTGEAPTEETPTAEEPPPAPAPVRVPLDQLLPPPPRGDLFERRGGDPSDSTDTGAGLLVAYGGIAGHYLGASFYTVITGFDFTDGTAPGIAVGAGGAAGSWLYVRDRDFSRDEAALAWASGTWGTFTGHQLARVLISPDSQLAAQRTAASGALSLVGATGLAMLFRNQAPALETSGLVMGAGAFGWQAGTGLGQVMGLSADDDRRLVATLELGGAYGAALGAWAANRLGLEVPSPGMASYYAGQGAWLGAWAPFLWQDRVSTSVNTGYVRLGAAAGAAASMALAPLAQGHPERLAGQTAGFGVGSLIGFGASSLFMQSPTRRSQAIGVLTGAIGGEVLGGVLGPRFEPDSAHFTFAGGLELWAGYQALGWGIWVDNVDGLDRQRQIGLPLLALGLGSALALVPPTLIDVDTADAAAALSAGAWGSAYGNWISFLAETTPQDNLRNMLLAGDAALVAGLSASLARPLDTRQIALIDGCGVAGAAAGGLVGIAIDGEPRTSTLATAIGASVGLAGGSALTAWRGPPSAGPTAVGALTPRRPRWLPARSAVIPSVMAAPWFAPDGSTGGLVQLTLAERE